MKTPTVFGQKTEGTSSGPSVFKSKIIKDTFSIESPKTPSVFKTSKNVICDEKDIDQFEEEWGDEGDDDHDEKHASEKSKAKDLEKPKVFGKSVIVKSLPIDFEISDLKDILQLKWNSNQSICSISILSLFDEDIKSYNFLIEKTKSIGNFTDFVFHLSRVKQLTSIILDTINSKWKFASVKKSTVEASSKELELCETNIKKEIHNILLKKISLNETLVSINKLISDIKADILFFEYLEKDEKFENVALSKKLSFGKTLVGLQELKDMVIQWDGSFDEMVLSWNNTQTNINQLQMLILQTNFDNITETEKYSFRSLINLINS